MQKNKVLVIVGQTATGKSELAVRLARRLRGEVISADSRQIYKGIDQGSGKIEKEEMRGVPHHLISVANPKKQFSVAEFQKMANAAIVKIVKKSKIPIIVGGTGFYIDALTQGIVLPRVSPNKELRKDLNEKSASELYALLKKLDRTRAENIDPKNKVRLVRAIEIAKALGKVPGPTNHTPPYEFVKIGLQLPNETLKRKIRLRLRKRLRSGMAIEIYNLHKGGVPWKRFFELGFDQRYTALYLQGKINEREMLEKLFAENWKYAKRQMTWFRRDSEIKWFDSREYSKILTYCKKKILN